MQMIDRRRFVVAVGAVALVGLAGRSAAQTAERDSDHPYLPNATFAQMVMATKVREDTLFTEPISMIFTAYGLPTEAEAESAFPNVVKYFEGRAAAMDAEIEYDQVSVGRLGDDRAGIYGISDTGARDLFVVVRVGSNILYVRAVALGGDTVEYVAAFLDGFLKNATDDPETLLPEIADLPVGWEFSDIEWDDHLLNIVTTEFPAATPFATPMKPGD